MFILKCLHEVDENVTHPFPLLEPSLTPSRTRTKMSEISAEISAIFRVSEAIEAKFKTLSRSLEKSPKIGKYRRYIGEISVFGRYFGGNFGHVEATRGANFCGIFWAIYRWIYRPASCVAEI